MEKKDSTTELSCSNPNCNCVTCGPAGDDKVSTIGQAAHITAASQGGPRFDPALTKEERASLQNGIWLCNNCAKLIDTNPQKYTVTLLREWKKQAEDKTEAEIDSRNKKTEEDSLLHGTENLSSNLSRIIVALSNTDLGLHKNKLPKTFDIDKKIDYNNLKSAKHTIENLMLLKTTSSSLLQY